MSRFQRIAVSGFRRLSDVNLELRPLTVLIGANGIGKTSVLEALALLGSSARGSLRSAILPGCAAHGPTQDRAFANAQDVIRLWIDTAREFGDPVPEPKGRRLLLA